MAKLCPKGKAAAKRKFDVYPSAYANMYASKVCKGKVRSSAKDGGLLNKPKRPPLITRPGQSPKGKNDIFIPERAPKKNPTRRKKMREGGMVIEDMTRIIEV